MRKKKRKKGDLANQAGISRQWLSKILTGRRQPSWSLAKRLAEATGDNPVNFADGNVAAMAEAIEKYLYEEEIEQ